MSGTNLGEPANKGEMMSKRLAAKLPMTMFTVDLRTGQVRKRIEHSTDWLNHLQFSTTGPDAPHVLPRGHWWWSTGSGASAPTARQNQLVHRRTMEMEIAAP